MQKKNILLVEDDYLDVIQVQRVLNKLKANCELHTAFNGKDALEMLNGQGAKQMDQKPDIILMDINMPRMNGLELLREIRSRQDLHNIPVFIMSTSFEEYDRTTAESLGIMGYILKPLNFDTYGNRATSMDTFNLLLEILR
jgi:CheY-like chemotaxis protein